MRIRASCRCNNISLSWQNMDFSLVPRKCGCSYCSSKKAEYVSKAGTAVDASVRREKLHRRVTQGSEQAEFHECASCGDIVLVTVSIGGELFCAINANCLEHRRRFPEPIEVDFSDQGPAEKLERWRQNWCHPVKLVIGGSSPGGA